MTKNKQVIIGAQNDPICAAQLATAEGSASAQNGGYLKPVWKKPWSWQVFAWETCLPREVLGAGKNQKAHREEESRWSA